VTPTALAGLGSRPDDDRIPAAAIGLFLLPALAGLRRRRLLAGLIPALLLLAVGLGACHNSASRKLPPAGTYSFTVTATSLVSQQTVSLKLVVQ
jgi:hypothetical protein